MMKPFISSHKITEFNILILIVTSIALIFIKLKSLLHYYTAQDFHSPE